MKHFIFSSFILFLIFKSQLTLAQCFTAPYGLYPSATFTPACTGVYQTITTCGWRGEYSNVNVVAGTSYTFQSSVATDIITIDNNGAAPAFTFGTGSVTWVATFTGVVRFYTHGPGCATGTGCRTKRVLCGSAVPPPGNNLVCNATSINCGQTLAGTTVNATNSGTGENQTCGTIQTTAGVWYVVTGTGATMTASLCGTAWDSKISVFSGPDCNTLTCVGGNDDNGPACGGVSASYTWTSVVGVNYYILVHGYSTTSAFNLALNCSTPCATNTVVLNLNDTFGDGWNGATYTLTNSAGAVVSTGTLAGGFTNSVTLCLPNDCYNMSVSSGTWPGEIAWNFNYNGNIVASGGAPTGNTQVPINIVCPPPPPTPQDCSGSQLVCADQAINGVSSGSGNTNDLNNTNQGCMTVEHQSLWLNATIVNPGTFSFSIIPTAADDYDFAVWVFPAGVPIPCPPNIPPTRCSWAGGTGTTGLGNGATDASEGATGDSWVSNINTTAGQQILILIDNFSSTTSPFTLDFTGTTSFASGGVITGTTSLCAGATSQLVGPGVPAALNPWVSSNTAVATISNTGVVTGISAGTATITYTNSSGCPTTTTVTVNALPATPSVAVIPATCTNPSSASITNYVAGQTYTFNPIGPTISGTGAISNMTVGTNYTVTVNNGTCTSNASSSFSVSGILNAPTVTGNSSVCINATTQLNGSGTPAALNQWVSGNTSVATISSTGLVTGISAGTSTITYTNSDGCSATFNITITPNVTPTFSSVGPFCSGATINALPTTSNEGITGTWSPVLDNTATTTYTFTPTAGQCATTTTLTITITPNVTPTFSSVGPFCSGATINALPTTSNEGITGTWSPVLDNTATTTYTFTPTAGQCATIAQTTIIINSTPTVSVTCSNICIGSTTTVSATTSPVGVYSFVWTVPSGPNPGNVNSFVTGITGTYSVFITDTTTNCVSTIDNCTIGIQAQPSVIFLSPP